MSLQIADSTVSSSSGAMVPPKRSALSHIPGEEGWPIIGRTLQVLADPKGEVERMAAKYGPVYRSRVLGETSITLLGPEANELVLFDKNKNFSSEQGWGPVLNLLFPRGLMLMDFEKHRQDRKALSVAFKPEPMRHYAAELDAGFRRSLGAFADALTDAQARGYAEPDSHADISGRDAAEKLAILLQLCGAGGAKPAQITTVGLDTIDAGDFAAARGLGGVLKPVAHAVLGGEGAGTWVGPALVDDVHALAGLRGVTNALVLTPVAGAPLLFAGPGAGPASIATSCEASSCTTNHAGVAAGVAAGAAGLTGAACFTGATGTLMVPSTELGPFWPSTPSSTAPPMKRAAPMAVARESTVAPLRAPKAAWLVPPPKALAMSPPLPCWRSTTSIRERQAIT